MYVSTAHIYRTYRCIYKVLIMCYDVSNNYVFVQVAALAPLTLSLCS